MVGWELVEAVRFIRLYSALPLKQTVLLLVVIYNLLRFFSFFDTGKLTEFFPSVTTKETWSSVSSAEALVWTYLIRPFVRSC